MKVLHIGKYYAPIEGGIESINRFVVEALKKYPQRVLSFNNKNNSCEEDIDGVSIVRASSTGILASQPISIKYFWELRRYIRLFDPDVIHFHYPNPLGALYLNLLIGYKRKLIVHWHSDIVAQKNLYRLIKPIEKKILEKDPASSWIRASVCRSFPSDFRCIVSIPWAVTFRGSLTATPTVLEP